MKLRPIFCARPIAILLILASISASSPVHADALPSWLGCALDAIRFSFLKAIIPRDATGRRDYFFKLVKELGVSPENFGKNGFFNTHYGTLVKDFKYPGVKTEAFLLGEGGSAQVYRVWPVGGNDPSFVVKRYRPNPKSGFTPKILNTVYEQDIDLMKLLHEKTDAFSLVTYTRGKEPLTIEIEDVKGTVLTRILQNDSVDIRVRERLYKDYQERAAKYFEQIKAAFPKVEIYKEQTEKFGQFEFKDIAFRVKDPKTGTTTYRLFIKPNQVIVDPMTLELKLVDPF